VVHTSSVSDITGVAARLRVLMWGCCWVMDLALGNVSRFEWDTILQRAGHGLFMGFGSFFWVLCTT